MSDALAKDIQALRERNRRVEAEKAWETSWFRRLILTGFTYVTALLFMTVSGLEQATLGACVPAGGFLISTLTLPPLKQFWMRHFHNSSH